MITVHERRFHLHSSENSALKVNFLPSVNRASVVKGEGCGALGTVAGNEQIMTVIMELA